MIDKSLGRRLTCNSWSVVFCGHKMPFLFPIVRRPMILHPAIDVWTTGIMSDNSDSKTLKTNFKARFPNFQKILMRYGARSDFQTAGALRCAKKHLPIKVFVCSNPNQAVLVCQLWKDTDLVRILKVCSERHSYKKSKNYTLLLPTMLSVCFKHFSHFFW